jgi:hypothetical protein
VNFFSPLKIKSEKIEYFLIVVSIFLVLLSCRSGVGISWDSTDYISVGKNMASGVGVRDVVGLPMTVRPPGISALICLGDWLGMRPSLTFVIVNALSSGLSTLFALLILRQTNVRKAFTVPTLMIIAFSPSLLNMYSMAWSEPIFIALVMAALWIALSPRSFRIHILLGLVFIAMFFIRYVGPFYSFPIAIIAIIVQFKKTAQFKSIFIVAGIYFVSIIPQYLWLLRNRSIDGTLTGVRAGAGGSYLNPIKTMLATFGSWVVGHDPLNGNGGIYLAWNDYSIIMKIFGCLFALSLILIIALFLKSDNISPDATYAVCGLIFVSFFYMAFSVIRFVHVEIGPLDNRMMSGIYIPLVLTFSIVLNSLVKEIFLQKLMLLLSVIFLLSFSVQSITSALDYGKNGRYWGSRVHQNQPLHHFVKGLDKNSQFMSNEPQMLFSVIEQNPIFNQYMNQQSFPRPCTQRYMVWYKVSFLPEAKPIGGDVIYHDALGEVIKLSDCSIPASTFWP